MSDVGAGVLVKRRVVPEDVIALSVYPFACFGLFSVCFFLLVFGNLRRKYAASITTQDRQGIDFGMQVTVKPLRTG